MTGDALDEAFPEPEPQVIRDVSGGFWVRIRGTYHPFTLIRQVDPVLPTSRAEVERLFGECVEVRA